MNVLMQIGHSNFDSLRCLEFMWSLMLGKQLKVSLQNGQFISGELSSSFWTIFDLADRKDFVSCRRPKFCCFSESEIFIVDPVTSPEAGALMLRDAVWSSEDDAETSCDPVM